MVGVVLVRAGGGRCRPPRAKTHSEEENHYTEVIPDSILVSLVAFFSVKVSVSPGCAAKVMTLDDWTVCVDIPREVCAFYRGSMAART